MKQLAILAATIAICSAAHAVDNFNLTQRSLQISQELDELMDMQPNDYNSCAYYLDQADYYIALFRDYVNNAQSDLISMLNQKFTNLNNKQLTKKQIVQAQNMMQQASHSDCRNLKQVSLTAAKVTALNNDFVV